MRLVFERYRFTEVKPSLFLGIHVLPVRQSPRALAADFSQGHSGDASGPGVAALAHFFASIVPLLVSFLRVLSRLLF